MLAQSNTGAVGFSLELADGRIHYLATEKLNFANCFAIRFVSDSLAVHHDTLRYPGIDWCHLKIKWNRKGGLFDFPKSLFFENSRFVFIFIVFKLGTKWSYDYFLSFFEYEDVMRSLADTWKVEKMHFDHFLNNDHFRNFRKWNIIFVFQKHQLIALRALPPVTRLTVHWRL